MSFKIFLIFALISAVAAKGTLTLINNCDSVISLCGNFGGPLFDLNAKTNSTDQPSGPYNECNSVQVEGKSTFLLYQDTFINAIFVAAVLRLLLYSSYAGRNYIFTALPHKNCLLVPKIENSQISNNFFRRLLKYTVTMNDLQNHNCYDLSEVAFAQNAHPLTVFSSNNGAVLRCMNSPCKDATQRGGQPKTTCVDARNDVFIKWC